MSHEGEHPPVEQTVQWDPWNIKRGHVLQLNQDATYRFTYTDYIAGKPQPSRELFTLTTNPDTGETTALIPLYERDEQEGTRQFPLHEPLTVLSAPEARRRAVVAVRDTDTLHLLQLDMLDIGSDGRDYYDRHEAFVHRLRFWLSDNQVSPQTVERVMADPDLLWRTHLGLVAEGCEYMYEDQYRDMLPFRHDPHPYEAYGESLLDEAETRIPAGYAHETDVIRPEQQFPIAGDTAADTGILSAHDGNLRIFITDDNRIGLTARGIPQVSDRPVRVVQAYTGSGGDYTDGSDHAELNHTRADGEDAFSLVTVGSKALERHTNLFVAIPQEKGTVYLSIRPREERTREPHWELSRLPPTYEACLDRMRAIVASDEEPLAKEMAAIYEANQTLAALRTAAREQTGRNPDADFDDRCTYDILQLMQAAYAMEDQENSSPLYTMFKAQLYEAAGRSRYEYLTEIDAQKNRPVTEIEILTARAKGTDIPTTERTLTPQEQQELAALRTRIHEVDMLVGTQAENFTPALRQLFMDGRKSRAFELLQHRRRIMDINTGGFSEKIRDLPARFNLSRQIRIFAGNVRNIYPRISANDGRIDRVLRNAKSKREESLPERRKRLAGEASALRLTLGEDIPLDIQEQLIREEQAKRQRQDV